MLLRKQYESTSYMTPTATCAHWFSKIRYSLRNRLFFWGLTRWGEQQSHLALAVLAVYVHMSLPVVQVPVPPSSSLSLAPQPSPSAVLVSLGLSSSASASQRAWFSLANESGTYLSTPQSWVWSRSYHSGSDPPHSTIAPQDYSKTFWLYHRSLSPTPR